MKPVFIEKSRQMSTVFCYMHSQHKKILQPVQNTSCVTKWR